MIINEICISAKISKLCNALSEKYMASKRTMLEVL